MWKRRKARVLTGERLSDYEFFFERAGKGREYGKEIYAVTGFPPFSSCGRADYEGGAD